ncbi:ATP-binding protein [Spongisporangium articulatum]|uniref:histidine kinase n=1 Tax=Spongisporangium articulatum TaxID=3362603 RepID=A0ABW8AMW7_9ACTN
MPGPVLLPTFAVVYAVAVYVGRLSRLEGTSLALVWPAAAVAFVWLLWATGRGRRQLALSSLVLCSVAAAMNWLTGSAALVALALGAANVIQALVELTVVRRLGEGAWQLRRSRDLAVWVTACLAGSAAGALIGPAVLAATANADFWEVAGAWTLRNASNTFVFGAVILRLARWGVGELVPPRGQRLELCVGLLVLIGAYAVVFGFADGKPLAYTVLPLSMWFALRFSTTIAAAHVLVSAVLVIGLTMIGSGPFATTAPALRVLLAQAFVAVVGLVALAQALHRDERDELLHSLDAARRQADAQSAELAAASRHKSEFLAHMSHEIRTPLNGVLGFTSLLAGAPRDPAAPQWAEAADRAGRVLLTIVNDGLDLAKIEAGGIELEDVEFDLLAVVTDAVVPLQKAADDAGLALEVVAGERLQKERRGDPVRLRQVVTNLVANAVKFTHNGSVTVTVDAPGHEVRIAVTDTGIGMSPEQVERLFTPFEQTAADINRLYGGTGLGLSIAQNLIQAMGGDIAVTSQPGRGTTMTVTVELHRNRGVPAPRAVAPQADPVVPSNAGAEGLAGLHLLVVDDNPTNLLLAKAMLRKLGITADVVENGEAAVVAAFATRYDAVLMDRQMPVMDGLEATRLIRVREGETGGRRLPIVAMTASAFEEDRRECLAAGMDGFLSKPWRNDELVVVLADLVATAA